MGYPDAYMYVCVYVFMHVDKHICSRLMICGPRWHIQICTHSTQSICRRRGTAKQIWVECKYISCKISFTSINIYMRVCIFFCHVDDFLATHASFVSHLSIFKGYFADFHASIRTAHIHALSPKRTNVYLPVFVA